MNTKKVMALARSYQKLQLKQQGILGKIQKVIHGDNDKVKTTTKVKGVKKTLKTTTKTKRKYTRRAPLSGTTGTLPPAA